MASRRRLVLDQSSLRRKGLPPNYLFSEESSTESTSDDMTQLSVLLTGANETPFSQGLWRLHLKIPEEYPKMPPKATFKTRIFHPNVEENTGTICVETLKRDWKPELTLRDVLVTISCLLIQPNPDSALNSTAGALLQEDYEAFARQAKLMTSIHAPIPSNMRQAVHEAKMRGEDADSKIMSQRQRQIDRPGIRPSSSSSSRASSTSSSVIMKKKAINNSASHLSSSASLIAPVVDPPGQCEEEPSSEEEEDPAKENNPSLSPSPVTTPRLRPISPRRSALGKRPLSVLPTPVDPDLELFSSVEHDAECHMTPSEQNISANISAHESRTSAEDPSPSVEPLRKSPKLSERTGTAGINASGRIRETSTTTTDDNGYETDSTDLAKSITAPPERTAEDEKENNVDYRQALPTTTTTTTTTTSKATVVSAASSTTKKSLAHATTGPVRPALRKTSTASSSGSSRPGSGTGTGKARVGIRRL